MTNPFLAAIDELRTSIARDSELLRLLEARVGVQTVDQLPALPAPRAAAPAPAKSPTPAGDRKRAGQVDVAKLRELHAQGLDDGQIGQQLGVSSSAICLWRKKLGLAAVGKGGQKTAGLPGGPAERVNAAATIVRWLKERGTIIAEVEAGKTWKVNGRDVIDRAGLLQMANRKREIAKLPPFEWEHGR